MHAVIVGAGVAGLGTALSLARRGHRVTVVERDDTPMPDSAAAAFEGDRPGAPQVRHSHALLGRLHNLLRDEHPDVLAALLDAGATEIRQADRMPETLDDRTPIPGDEDLTLIASRRTTFEWVLRRAVLGTEGVEVRTGVALSGLCGDHTAAIPHIDGVVLADGSVLGADLVVAANGRRSAVPDQLAEIGVTIPDEEVEDTGIVYASRFYELEPGEAFPDSDRLVGGDLTYLKYGVFWGDNDTFSLTLAVAADDTVLRNAIRDPGVFDAIGRRIPAVAPWLDGRAHAITEVHSMAGLLDRRRRFVVDETPVVTGLVAVGDAHICTNPLYGRGCTTGMWQADLLARAADDHGEDPTSLAAAYDASVTEQVEPWYRSSVDSDRSARRALVRARAIAAGEDVPEESDEEMKRSILREGLSPATRTDAVVWRAFCRTMNLLAPPTHLHEPDIAARVMRVWQDRANRPPEPPLGPPRDEMLAAVEVT